MRRKALSFIAAVALLCATLAAAHVPALAQNNASKDTQQSSNGNNDLAGTWLTKTTPPDPLPPFQGIFNFAGDGSLTATQAGGDHPALGNPQLGLWSRKAGSKRQFTLTYYGQDFDENFQLTDSYRVRGALTLSASGDSFTGVLDITVYDLDGNEVFSDCCANFEGRRVGLEPPGGNTAGSLVPNPNGYTQSDRGKGWSRRSNKTKP